VIKRAPKKVTKIHVDRRIPILSFNRIAEKMAVKTMEVLKIMLLELTLEEVEISEFKKTEIGRTRKVKRELHLVSSKPKLIP
jgi:hypothetical protein